MNWTTVRTLLIHELRMLTRDRRTVILSIVLPIAVMPLMLFGTRYVEQRREKTLAETVYRYAVTGTEADTVRALLAQAQVRLSRSSELKEQDDEESLAGFRFEEVRVASPDSSLKSKDIHFYLEAVNGIEGDARARKADAEKKERARRRREQSPDSTVSEPVRLPGVPVVTIYSQEDRDASQAGLRRMRRLLVLLRGIERDALLRERGFPVEPKQVIAVEPSSVATAGQVTGSWIGRFLTVFLLTLMLSGGSIAAMDSVAGEKERGSLETLLTTAASRAEIVAAKQLTILLVALLITLIQVTNILVYLNLRLIELPKTFIIEAPPALIVTLLLLFIPMAAVVASVLLMLSAYAKSYKEAQLYFFPVYLVSLAPALAAVLPGVSLRSAIAVVPVANVSVAVREVMVGKYDWPMIGVTLVVMIVTAGWLMRVSARMLSMERLITASEADVADLTGGPALFPKHVLRWYGVMWAVIFAVAANVPELATLKRQLFFNEVVIFLGVPALMIWKYRLNVREALALRPVKPLAWLAVLLAVPSGLVTALGVFRLANLFLPVPERLLERFGQEFMPSDIPFWQLLLLLAVLPGICEEIGFRGLLLYGLRRRFRPVRLVLVIGAIFGLFHVALFRLIPTAFLGVTLTGIVLLTGSIFPSMFAHAASNALSFWAARQGWPLVTLDWWWYLATATAFALSFYLLYRIRTPYPDLRS